MVLQPSAVISHLKINGFDLKALIKQESYYMPAVSIGLRDIAGTGLFSSEYIVTTKKIGYLDFSVGIGWGILGTDNNLTNPLNSVDESFKFRNESIGEGGTFSFKNWFSGKSAIFSGIEYDLPKQGLRLKLEYDTSNPDERINLRPVKVDSRFNIGLSYAFSENLSFSSSFERGSQFRIGFSLKGNFLKDTISKPPPKTVQRLNDNQIERIKNDNNIFYRSLNLSLRDESIYIQAASLKENEIDVAVASSRFYTIARPVGRTARIVSALAPSEIEKINIHAMNGDFEVATVSLGRKYFEDSGEGKMSSVELLQLTQLTSQSSSPLYKDAKFIPNISFPEFSWNMSPALKHQIVAQKGFIWVRYSGRQILVLSSEEIYLYLLRSELIFTTLFLILITPVLVLSLM